MPKQNPQSNAETPKQDTPSTATMTVEDMAADTKPRPAAKPVNVTKLPNGVVIEDY